MKAVGRTLSGRVEVVQESKLKRTILRIDVRGGAIMRQMFSRLWRDGQAQDIAEYSTNACGRHNSTRRLTSRQSICQQLPDRSSDTSNTSLAWCFVIHRNSVLRAPSGRFDVLRRVGACLLGI
jgi:hypothetical protein